MAEEADAKQEKPAEGTAGAEGAAPAEGDAAAAEGAAKAKKKKMLMIISGAVALVGVCVALGVVFFAGGGSSGEHEEPEPAEVAVMDLPEMTVNLLTEEGSNQHFMKIKLAVELDEVAHQKEAEALMPRLQDDWGAFLRQMRPMDMQGSAATQRLKEGLLRRAQQSLAPTNVKAVYIREMLVQ